MRGFLGGVSVGALLAAGGLMMLSLSVPLPERLTAGKPAADTAETEPGPSQVGQATDKETAEGAVPETPVAKEREAEQVADAPRPPAPDTGATPLLPNGGDQTEDAPVAGQPRDADLAEALPTGPETSASPDDLSALAAADTAPAQRPQVAADPATGDPSAPKIGVAPGLDAPSEAQPPQPKLQKPGAPLAPDAEAAVVAATDPAPAPATRETDGITLQGEADAETDETPALALDLPQAERPDTGRAEVRQPDSGTAATGPSGQAVVQAPDIGMPPRATTLPVIGATPTLPDATGTGAKTDDEGRPDDAPVTQADSAQPDASASLSPQIGTPVVPLTDRDDLAQDSAAAATFPFAAYAEPFANPSGQPLMSIVLIDDTGAVGAEALADFPYPLSFAIDPDDPDATTKMAARRAAGFEVLMLADLPRDAAPQDAETALEVWRRQLPEAVAILEGVETGVQGNRALADQVAAVAASAGYGLVTQNSGLNTVQKLALRDGVPAGVVFRDFDGAGQDPRAIRRFLDQAAFRAGQEGAVIMLGRLRPDTISALLIWGLQDRASRVALAPVSASLEAKLPPK